MEVLRKAFRLRFASLALVVRVTKRAHPAHPLSPFHNYRARFPPCRRIIHVYAVGQGASHITSMADNRSGNGAHAITRQRPRAVLGHPTIRHRRLLVVHSPRVASCERLGCQREDQRQCKHGHQKHRQLPSNTSHEVIPSFHSYQHPTGRSHPVDVRQEMDATASSLSSRVDSRVDRLPPRHHKQSRSALALPVRDQCSSRSYRRARTILTLVGRLPWSFHRRSMHSTLVGLMSSTLGSEQQRHHDAPPSVASFN
jgi:hypothetical protein